VSELGSFTKASKVLNQPKSRVSRAISKLERELGVELIRRTTRKVSLTSVGEELYKNITPHLLAIQGELTRISDKSDEMTGKIRITTSDSFAQNILADIISIYNSKYPQVEFEMIITNEYLDLVEENIDLAFRAGKLKDSTLIQKQFIKISFMMVCSKTYIDKHSLITDIKDLNSHKYLSFKPLESQLKENVMIAKPVLCTDS
jgi:LysR family transcriptional regulator for bpeEF and oprC